MLNGVKNWLDLNSLHAINYAEVRRNNVSKILMSFNEKLLLEIKTQIL